MPMLKERRTGRQKQNESNQQPDHKTVSFVCVSCRENENIPLSVVRDFDDMDAGDLKVPLWFVCDACGGEMYPEYYKGIHGFEYRIEDRPGARAQKKRKR